MNEHITLTISKPEKRALKQAALDNDCSVSELIRRDEDLVKQQFRKHGEWMVGLSRGIDAREVTPLLSAAMYIAQFLSTELQRKCGSFSI